MNVNQLRETLITRETDSNNAADMRRVMRDARMSLDAAICHNQRRETLMGRLRNEEKRLTDMRTRNPHAYLSYDAVDAARRDIWNHDAKYQPITHAIADARSTLAAWV